MEKKEGKNLTTNDATQKITMREKFALIYLGIRCINKYLTRSFNKYFNKYSQ